MNNCPETVMERRPVCCCASAAPALCVFAFLLALTLGLVLGAYFYEIILPAAAAVIAFGAAILAIVAVLLIYRFRRGC